MQRHYEELVIRRLSRVEHYKKQIAESEKKVTELVGKKPVGSVTPTEAAVQTIKAQEVNRG